MSLISLLFALAFERYLSSSTWQFQRFFQRYINMLNNISLLSNYKSSVVVNYIVILIPVIACYLLLAQIEHTILHLIASSLILIVCFGCVKTRAAYKNYLTSAFKGELTTCELQHMQLQQDKNIADMGFGQTLVWLNYRYFIAVMILFVLFGAAGALFYRLLTTFNESYQQQVSEQQEDNFSSAEQEVNAANKQLLFWVDWLPVRIVALGYMLVGHFSKALPVWLENLFEFDKAPCQVLIAVAQKSEDFMVDADDCTAEPCLLVKLAKRTLLLFLSVIAVLILTGVIS